jgi:hypothetical protein
VALEDPLYRAQVDEEIRKRIRVSIFAYAYEVLNESLVSDAEFDALAKSINPTINTRRPDLDRWFRENFTPATGMWVRTHPDLARIHEITIKHFLKRNPGHDRSEDENSG